MKMKHHLLSLTYALLLECCGVVAIGQTPFNFVASPMLSQSSRVSSNLSQFTGKLGVSVPIYSYKSTSSNLALNVSLDYSGGGLNILENPSCVGAGWNLTAGGSIFRSINGLPDDRDSALPTSLGYFFATGYVPDTPCCNNYQYPGYYPDPMGKIHMDGEEDDYYFDFNGRQGRLMIPQDILSSTSAAPIQTIPQSTCRIQILQGVNPANVTSLISGFVITDEKGIQYTFSAIETIQKKIPTLVSDGGSNYHYTYAYPTQYFGTAWRLTKMLDLNTQDEIDFNYISYPVSYKVPDYPTTYTNQSSLAYSNYDDGQDLYKGTCQRLSSIQFKNGDMISFAYDSKPRADFVSDNALLQIEVLSALNGHQITYNLQQSYLSEQTLGTNAYQVVEAPYSTVTAGTADNLGLWLFLKGVTQQANDNSGTLPVARFGYNRNLGTETSVSVPTRFSAASASNWGNAVSGTQGFFGYLDTVYNVNGGYTLYTHGYNDYTLSTGGTGLPGGLRVTSITQSDGVNHVNDLVTTYTYQTAAGTSSGFMPVLPPNYYLNALSNGSGGSIPYAVTLAANTGIIPASTLQGSPVGYSQVTETVTGLGQTVYQFTSLADYPPLYTTLPYPFPNMPQLVDWAYGLPKMTTMYDQSGRMVRSVQNIYNVIITPVSTPNYRSMKMAFRTEASSPVLGNPGTCAQMASTWNFSYQLYYPTTGQTQLMQTITTDYPLNANNAVSTVRYTYDPTYYVRTSSTTTDSKGETVESIPFYLFQTSNTSTAAYSLASTDNLLTSPYGSLTLLTHTDGTEYITSYSKINYAIFNGMIKPQQLLSAKLGAPVSISSTQTTFTPDMNYGAATTALSEDASFDQYDAAGTLVQVTEPLHNQVKSLVWDNSVHQQMAQCNTAYATMDYTSFENQQNGGWTVGGASATYLSGGITGSTAFSGTLSRAITVPGNYTLTLWCAVGTTATVNGAAGQVLLTRRNYQLESWSLNNVTNPTAITVQGTNIDEVRLFPQGAQMSTSTYSPMVGITSACDASNRIVYYEYDVYNRLTDVRDQDGNIIRTFNYHYRGQ
jgi:hypothetical protein